MRNDATLCVDIGRPEVESSQLDSWIKRKIYVQPMCMVKCTCVEDEVRYGWEWKKTSLKTQGNHKESRK